MAGGVVWGYHVFGRAHANACTCMKAAVSPRGNEPKSTRDSQSEHSPAPLRWPIGLVLYRGTRTPCMAATDTGRHSLVHNFWLLYVHACVCTGMEQGTPKSRGSGAATQRPLDEAHAYAQCCARKPRQDIDETNKVRDVFAEYSLQKRTERNRE